MDERIDNRSSDTLASTGHECSPAIKPVHAWVTAKQQPVTPEWVRVVAWTICTGVMGRRAGQGGVGKHFAVAQAIMTGGFTLLVLQKRVTGRLLQTHLLSLG